MNLKNKKVFVSGSTGMVGRELVNLLLEKGAKVSGASLDSPERVKQDGVEFIQCDLRDFNKCLEVTEGKDIVFHIAGIKGSPTLTRDKPASFFVPTLQFNTNVLEAARVNNAQWTLYTSTVGVYGPAEIFREDGLWDQLPSKNDFFAGMAKRIGELQLDAYRTQYPNFKSSIVRPVNIHGPGDGFNPNTSMVIPSLIYKALNSKDKMICWGDGSPIRDFVSSYDVARAMIFCVENEIEEPVNIGSGRGISIKELTETILKYTPNKLEIEWDTTKPNGDAFRVADTSRLAGYGFKLEKSLDQSIKELIEWYLANKHDIEKRYDVFETK